MEAKLKHLEFVQNAITRMAHNSFLLKGWAITLVTAILTISKSIWESENGTANTEVALIAMFVTAVFWGLDGFFLCTEERFRGLYKDVANTDKANINFAMNPLPYATPGQYRKKTFSKTLAPFYGCLLVLPCLILHVSVWNIISTCFKMVISLIGF